MRLLELDPQFAQEFPKYKHVKKGGFSVFKGKAGKGMPEEVGVFLRERLQFFRQGMVFNPPSLYRPPIEVPPPASSTSKPLSGARHSQEQDTLWWGQRRLCEAGARSVVREHAGGRSPHSPLRPACQVRMLPMRELRHLHRTWLTPHLLDRDRPTWSVPANFRDTIAPSGDHAGKAIVLSPIGPLNYIARGANSQLGECPTLALGRHPAANAVVARKMLSRLAEDAAWLRDQAASEARAPHLAGFDGAAPSQASFAQQESVLNRLVGALDKLHADDLAAFEAELPQVLQLASQGPPNAPESERRARALAQWAQCERPIGLGLLSELLMSRRGEVELRALNPLLGEQDARAAMDGTAALLLRVSRSIFAAKARAVAWKLQRTLASLKAKLSAGGGAAAQADVAQAVASLRVVSETLARTLCFRRAHVTPPKRAPPGAAGVGADGVVPASLDPRMLVFEFAGGMVLRPPQVSLISKLVSGATQGRSMCHQMLMGEGKTTVIAPMLALLIGDGSMLVTQIVPTPLLRFSHATLRSAFSAPPLHKPVWTFRFDRRASVTIELLDKARDASLGPHLPSASPRPPLGRTSAPLDQVRAAVTERAVLLSTPAAVKAFLLKLLELLHLLDTGQYPKNLNSIGEKMRRVMRLKPRKVTHGRVDTASPAVSRASSQPLLTFCR